MVFTKTHVRTNPNDGTAEAAAIVKATTVEKRMISDRNR